MNMPPPRTTGVYPAAVALGTLSFIAIILDLPPLIWHSKNRNIAASLLISWIIVINLLSLINVFLWPNDNISSPSFHDGSGLCDVEAKLLVGRTTALPAATFCILKGLADVMNTKKITLGPAPGKEWKPLVFNLGFGLGLPLISMVLHYIVQTARYDIVGISGCVPVSFQSSITVVLLDLPPLLLTAVDVYLCILITYRLRTYRTRFTSLLRASNTTKTRFLRLLILSLVFIFVLFPIQLYILFLNWPKNPAPFSWSRIHSPAAWNQLVFVPSYGAVLPDRWVGVTCGFVVFAAFGVGKDAMSTYKSWAIAVGLGRVFPALMGRDRRGEGESSAWMSSFGSRVGIVSSKFGRRRSGVTETTTEIGTGTGLGVSVVEEDVGVEDTWHKGGSQASVTKLVAEPESVKSGKSVKGRGGSRLLHAFQSPAIPVRWMNFRLPMRQTAAEKGLPLTEFDSAGCPK
ncbi:hypothetical protein MBLNU457_g0848t1 [Dothideomycetes sp. NU457]